MWLSRLNFNCVSCGRLFWLSVLLVKISCWVMCWVLIMFSLCRLCRIFLIVLLFILMWWLLFLWVYVLVFLCSIFSRVLRLGRCGLKWVVSVFSLVGSFILVLISISIWVW